LRSSLVILTPSPSLLLRAKLREAKEYPDFSQNKRHEDQNSRDERQEEATVKAPTTIIARHSSLVADHCVRPLRMTSYRGFQQPARLLIAEGDTRMILVFEVAAGPGMLSAQPTRI
jgi:hypothetical protein